ncbi:MAG TPA: AMP-dependent synthetase/ligase [Myxococcaceae bacterium]|nr:AMP-dependent synthetase/ligase [Myxococcaceae bacterium]
MASIRTLIDSLAGQAQQRPDTVAITSKRGGAWVDMTWKQVFEEVRILAAGLAASGVQPGERVAIFANTSLEWVLCDYAIAAAGAIVVPIYGSNTPDETRYILQNSEAVLCFVDHDTADGRQPGRLTRLRGKLAECPSLRQVVLFEGEGSGAKESTLATLRQKGEAALRADAAAFDARVKGLGFDEPSHFIYTSGTTGDPKGVMLTHHNWAFVVEATRQYNVLEPNDSAMLFLPLAHVFAQVVKAAWVGMGFKLVIAESAEKLLQNLPETKPTILPSVPRVFEKVYNGVIANGSSAPGLKGRLFRWAMSEFDRYVEAREKGQAYRSVGFTLAQRLVFSKVKATLNEKLGGRLRLFISGGAPLARKIAYFFDLLGLRVTEGYGLTETTGPATVAPPDKIKIGTVGPPLSGCELKIAPDGEVLIRGPIVMKGYFKNPAATAEVIDADGWFHSGDIGELDEDGYVRITDRKKDLIITAAGKNIAPQNLENLLKTYPIISQAMVHGDRRHYLTALVTVSEEPARKLLAEKGTASAGTYAELAKRPEIREAVQEAINAVNAQQPPYNTIKRFALLDHDLAQDTGELTPTLKVKRKQLTQKYKALLDGLYEERAVE